MKIAGFRGPSVAYFAFGGNLDPSVLSSRRISVRRSRPLLLDGYELVFDQQGPFQGGGFASISASAGRSVFGVVYEIPKIDEWRLDYFEAHLFLRKYKKVQIDGGKENFYFYQTTVPKSGLLPTRSYLNSILKCYEQHSGLSGEKLARLRNLPVLRDEIPEKHISLIVRDYRCWGPAFEGFLKWYDGFCFKVFIKLIYRPSLFGRWVPD